MQATLALADKPATSRRQRRLPRVAFDIKAFLDFMASKGFDSPAKVARELGINQSVLTRLEETGGRTSIDFMGLLWAKYPDQNWNQFLIVPGLPRAAAA